MVFKRQSGILLHPTSLPSKYGIGDMGKEAYNFVDFLRKTKQKLWQVLPLNPPGHGESPYQPFSAFAGNPMLISIDKLYEEGLLSRHDISDIPCFDIKKVEFTKVKNFKEKLFRKAFKRFKTLKEKSNYRIFVHQNKIWLENYSLFMALSKYFRTSTWNHWKKAIAFRNKEAVICFKNLLFEEIEYNSFLQFMFFTQWIELKNHANCNKIKIIGDLPIFVSYNSSDVWANPHLFELDQSGNPLKVAGVPPDYFSETGQLWGNPLYNWSEMEKDDYKWWRERFQNLLKLVDIIRIDHFRGFEAYWEIPAGEKTAVNGRWVKGPGDKFFLTIKKYLGDIPVIAEDLGFITPEVEKLRKKFNFPGMKVIQFVFESKAVKPFSTLEFEKNTVLYTGTHDNDTILGWYKNIVLAEPEVAKTVNNYLLSFTDLNEKDICWRFIEIALQSSANTVIIPLQDLLCLDSSARMNHPGTVGRNWEWRFQKKCLNEEIENKLRDLTTAYNR